MQREYQVCPSGLLNGMAITFAKETLRALQDTIQVYEAVLSEYAEITSFASTCSTRCRTLR